MSRILDYYDLIELPSGKHIPIPLAIKTVGVSNILKIPIADRKRDEWFYYCPQCDEYSFFRCTEHKPIDKHENNVKLTMLKILCKLNMHKFMRYIEVDEECWYARRKGFVLVIRDGRWVGVYNLMLHYRFDWLSKLLQDVSGSLIV